MSENRVVVKKVIKAGKDEVFDAFTNPVILSKWFCPGDDFKVDVTNTLEVGGSYSIIMHLPGGKSYTHVGEYREIEPPEKLVFTWSSDAVDGTIVTVTFDEVDGGTEVTITHDLLPSEEQRENHRKGWTGCLRNLEKLFT